MDDLLGLCLIGREKGSKRWLIWAHAWAWSIVWKRRQDIATKLDEFIAEGSLTRCEMPDEDDLGQVTEGDDAETRDLTEDVRGVVDVLVKVRDAGRFPAQEAIGLYPAGVAAIVHTDIERDGALGGAVGAGIAGAGIGGQPVGNHIAS